MGTMIDGVEKCIQFSCAGWDFNLYLQCLHGLKQCTSCKQWEQYSWRFKSENSQELHGFTFNL
jgi:hypothetical protein